MIGYLRGKIIEKSLSSATVLVGQVGYDVNLPASVLSKIKKDEEVELWIYTHVREDILALFGFSDKESLEFFKLLLSVSGIGPKVALAIISAAPLAKISESISRGDPTMLSSVSGVGRKTAEKAVVELKGKLGNISAGSQIFSIEGEETLDALLALGFSKAEAAEAISKLPEELSNTDEKIKAALKLMNTRSSGTRR